MIILEYKGTSSIILSLIFLWDPFLRIIIALFRMTLFKYKDAYDQVF